MNLSNDQLRFLRRLVHCAIRAAKEEIREESWRPDGPRSWEVAVLRRHKELATGIYQQLLMESPQACGPGSEVGLKRQGRNVSFRSADGVGQRH